MEISLGVSGFWTPLYIYIGIDFLNYQYRL